MRLHLLSLAGPLLCCAAASAVTPVESLVFDTGEPQAMDLGEGPNYYGVQSIVGSVWYSRASTEEDCTAVADWFTVTGDTVITSVTFWGRLKEYGEGPGELHIWILSEGSTGLQVRFHAWSNDLCDWSTFLQGDRDPSGILSESVQEWHVPLASLPAHEGYPKLLAGSRYLLVIAGDDWASEFFWAVNPPGGINPTPGPQMYAATSSSFADSPLSWSPADLGQGPQPNNTAFRLWGVPSAAPDFDEDGDVDQADFGRLQLCLAGSALLPDEPVCGEAELDDQPGVTGSDVEAFRLRMTGPK